MSRFLFFLTLYLSFLLLATAHGGGHDDDEDGADHGDSQVGLRSKPLILMKIWCLILVFVGTFIGGVSPYFLKWNEGFLVLGTHFAGGVFFGIVQMHLTSATNEAFEELTRKDYPFAFMLSIAGTLMTMFADWLISYVHGKGRYQSNGDVEIQGSLEQGGKADNGSHLQVHHGGPANPALATVADWIFAISTGLACGAFPYATMKLILSKGYVPQAAVSVDTPYYE